MLPKELIDKYYVWKGDTFSKNKDSFAKLAKEGQSPQYMIISCVDSRVDRILFLMQRQVNFLSIETLQI